MNFSRSNSKKNGEKILCQLGLGTKNKTLPGPNRDPEKLKALGLGPGPMEEGITGTGTKNTWSRTSLIMSEPFLSQHTACIILFFSTHLNLLVR
jgi:hypothetical protein